MSDQASWRAVAVVGVIAVAGCGRTTPAEAPPAGSPIAAEPAGPPPPFAPTLAAPAAPEAKSGSAIDRRLERVASAAAALGPELAKVSLDAKASGALVVQAGGRQADIEKGEVPRHQRWEIRFPPGNSLESYTRQLDHFKIELGVIGVEDHITYLTNLSNPRPERRPGFASDEPRLYLVWQRGEMAEADQQLAARAGIRTAGKVLVHFVPSDVETELARLEEAYAKQLGIQKIGKTVFGIRVAGQEGFRFYVIEQKPDLR